MRVYKIRINGIIYNCYSKKEMLVLLLLLIDENSPAEAIRINIKQAFELVGKRDKRSWKTVDRIKTKDKLLAYCYNLILNAEGFGLLWGFSVIAPIGKGDTYYNPEVRSMVNLHV